MQKRMSFYVVFVFVIAIFVTAGCSKQEIVKKDEGIAPMPSAMPADSKKQAATASTKSDAVQALPKAADQMSPATQSSKLSSSEQLQSALEKIYFDFDSSDITASARDILSRNAAEIMKEQLLKIRIEGNCDERGSAEYNLALGERRAKAARQYLVNLGVKPERLSTISYGKEKPAVQGNNEAAWAKNRRDEFVIVK